MPEPERSPRYRVLRELGRGGMGIVHLVHDAVRGQDVAMKRISVPDTDAIVRFKREFRVMEGLHHPSLVRLYELGADDDGLYFTMELVRGTTLRLHCRPEVDSEKPTMTAGREFRRAIGTPISGVGASPLAITGTFRSAGVAAPGPASPEPIFVPRACGEALSRFVEVLPQLLGALGFLHGRGIVHRDLKPGNVMVTAEGHLKLLDFGILSELGHREPTHLEDHGLSSARGDAVPAWRAGASSPRLQGTIGYIAPEVLRGEPAGPASDLYALGVIMFDILAGRPVFDGDPVSVLVAHLGSTPPRLSDVATDVPPALVEVCAALLEKTPAARPSLDDVGRAALGERAPRRAPVPARREAAQAALGREEEKRTLLAALEPSPRGFAGTVVVGPSGSGKTTLAAWAAREAQGRGALVLHGRGRPTERLPYNAVDGAIDELAVALREGDAPDAALDADLACASSAFPVLAACCQDAAPISTSRPRVLVFEACARVLGHVARARPVLLFIDDLQWADDDSLAALAYLLDAAPVGVRIVTTLRDDLPWPPATHAMLARPDVTKVPLGALDEAALTAIVGSVAREEGTELGPETVRRAVLGCAGRPFLAEVTARALAHDRHAQLDERNLTAAMLAPALHAHGGLLALLVAADGSLDLGVLAELQGTSVGEMEDVMAELGRAGIVRTAGALGQVVLYHDVVRGAALEALGEEPLVRAHGALADWLGSRTGSRPEPRVVHLLGARREREAVILAREAAAHALRQRAYALAAEMLAIALRDAGDDRASLLRKRAEALDLAAQYAAAAKCWAELATMQTGEAALDATLSEAASLLASHDLKAGMERLREGLARAGLPPIRRSKLTDVVTGLRFLAGPAPTFLVARRPTDPAAVKRCERDVRVALLVVYIDPLAGTRFLQRVRDQASRSGAPEVAAWCDWTFAYYALFLNPRHGPVPLADRYVASARSLSAEDATTLTSDRTATMAGFVAGVAAERKGDWDAASVLYDRALESAERVGFGTTEHALVLMNRAQVDFYAQRFHGLARLLGTMRAVSRASPQTILASYADIIDSFALVQHGKIVEARALHTDVMRRLEAGGENRLAHAIRLFGYAIDVYESQPGAHLRFARDLEAGRRFGATRYMRLGAVLAIGGLVEANALRRGEPGASFARAMKLAKQSLDCPPYMVGAAYRAMAYAHDAQDDASRAVELLQRAEREALERGQPVDRAIARYQLGRRMSGAAGESLLADARREVVAAGASELALRDDVVGR